MVQYSGHKMLRLRAVALIRGCLKNISAALREGKIHVQAAAAFIWQRLRHKAGVQAVSGRNGLHRRLKGQKIIGGGHRVAVFKIDFILPRPLLVMRGLRMDAHLLQGQADFPPDIFALVVGGDIAVASEVVGIHGRIALFIGFKQIKFALGTDLTDIAHLRRLFDGSLQNMPGASLKRPAVGIVHIAEQPHHPAVGGPPG